MLNRRIFLTSGAALAACSPQSGSAPKKAQAKKLMAITMDDFDIGFDLKLSPVDRNAAILAAFAAHNHKAAGFVTGRFVDSDMGRSVVQSWSDAGHMIANHTWSHMNSTDEETDVIKSDILKNHQALKGFNGYEKILRFPFLAEGGSVEKVEDYRAFMDVQGFANAPVAIDSIDWAVTTRMENRLRENANADLSGYRDYYLQSVREISEQKHQLALRLGFTNLPHTVLMHHNILNGLFLKDLMDALAEDGWGFIDAKTALAHPLYAMRPQTPNSGRSVLSVLAQEAGIETDFPKAYFGHGKETMKSLGL